MYKVLIADDERKICQLLQYLVNWKTLNMEIIGIVHNGSDALEIVKKEKPDIIITDIRMPECGGLDLIQQVKAAHEDIDFVIISGHRQFEYARKALQFGAEDYLLKPIKQSELERVLKRIIVKKQASMESEEAKRDLEQTVLEDVKKLNTVFVRDLVLQKVKDEDLNREYVNREYKCNFVYRYFRVLCVKLDVEYERLSAYELNQIMEKRVCSVMEQNFNSQRCCFCSYLSEDVMYVVVNYEDIYAEELDHCMRHIISDIKEISDMKAPVHATIGVSSQTEAVAELKEAVIRAREAVLDRIVQGVDRIIAAKDSAGLFTVKDFITYSVHKQLLEGMEYQNQAQIIELCKEIFAQIEDTQRYDGKLLYDVSREINNILLLGCKMWFEEEDIEEMKNEFLHGILMSCNKEMLKHHLELMLKNVFMKIEKQQDEKEKRPVQVAKQYIQLKYASSLTLDEVSAHVGLNAAYFSSVFKKETDYNFSEYLTMVRMKKAKELLLDAGRTVFEISHLVGYSDEKYFSRAFRKTVGLTPSEYRRLYC